MLMYSKPGRLWKNKCKWGDCVIRSPPSPGSRVSVAHTVVCHLHWSSPLFPSVGGKSPPASPDKLGYRRLMATYSCYLFKEGRGHCLSPSEVLGHDLASQLSVLSAQKLPGQRPLKASYKAIHLYKNNANVEKPDTWLSFSYFCHSSIASLWKFNLMTKKVLMNIIC